MDINKWLADRPRFSKYGAPMGDDGVRGDPNRDYKFHLQKIELDRGGYDRAGTYWGLRFPGMNLWGFMCEDDEDGLVYGFVDGVGRGGAKDAVRGDYPNARFCG